MLFDYDLAVIGAGSAGFAAAQAASQDGLRTILIEGGKEVGGLCILGGCMPTKALLYAAEIMRLAQQAETWGIHVQGLSFDFERVMARKSAIVTELAEDRRQQLREGKFKFVRALARFQDSHTLALSTGESISAEFIIIATGSLVAPCPVRQLDDLDCLNSDRALELKKLPTSLIVLGGGAVAVEFAQFFARFGVKVTLIQRGSHILHNFDAESAEELENAFRQEGITIYTSTRLLGGRRTTQGKEVEFEHRGKTLRVQAERVFYALGRVPHVEPLELAQAGVDTAHGRIVTTSRMQTSTPNIYAVGDCTGPYDLLHLAVQQGEIAAFNVAHPSEPKQIDYRLLTQVVFTDPQIAQVGLNRNKARQQNVPVLAASHPFKEQGKAMIMGVSHGVACLLVSPESGEILGASCVGPIAGELIHEIIAAMSNRMTVTRLAAMPHYHPTLAEIWTYPAEELARKMSPQTQASRVLTSAEP